MASGDTLARFLPYDNEPPSSNYATLDTRNGHPVLTFDGSTDWEAVFSGIMPRHYGGGGVTVYLYVMFASATSGNAFWQVAFERMNAGGLNLGSDSFGSFKGAAGNPNATSGIMTQVAIAFSNGTEMSSIAAGDPFRIKIHRDADGTAGTDDVTTNAQAVAIEIKET